VARSGWPKHINIYKGAPLPLLCAQSHSRISSLCVCARVPFVYKSSVNRTHGGGSKHKKRKRDEEKGKRAGSRPQGVRVRVTGYGLRVRVRVTG